MTSLRSIIGLLAGLLLSTACSTGGGTEDRPISEVTISASHRMTGLGGDQLIPKFPIPKSAAGTDLGVFTMNDKGEYTIARGSATSAPLRYDLANDGTMSVVVPVSNSSPTRFVGAYRSGVKMAEVFFFTDRFAPTNNPVVGLFWGTRTTTPPKNGDVNDRSFYFFSQHVIFSTSVFPDKNDVGRSIFAEIAVSKTKAVTGTAFESSGASLPMTGTAEGFANESVDFTIDFKKGSTPDVRTFHCGQTHDVLLGVDEKSTGNKAGLVAMIQKRELLAGTPPAPLSEADARKLISGSYHFGMHTIFVATGRSGIDAANGTIEFNEQGGWKLTGVGSKGPQNGTFGYSGSYAFELVANKRYNKLILTVNGPPKETWVAAVDEAFGVVVIVDNEIENRGIEVPELNLMLATRVAVVK